MRELLGPRDISYSEATQILGERIGKPDLQYVQFSCDDQSKALVQAGLSEAFANLWNCGVLPPAGCSFLQSENAIAEQSR